MGWVERFGDQLIFSTLSPLLPQYISRPHKPKPTQKTFFQLHRTLRLFLSGTQNRLSQLYSHLLLCANNHTGLIAQKLINTRESYGYF